MKAIISYINNEAKTIIENDLSFEDFCLNLFKKKFYLSIVNKDKGGVSLAINTDNIVYVEELR